MYILCFERYKLHNKFGGCITGGSIW